jgi:hypothetical protein
MSRARLGLALAVAALTSLGACQTVDLGDPPADVNACEPGQQWFIDQVWPNFLGADYSGKHCYDSTCHGPGSTTAMTLTNPIEPGAIPFPTDWANNYAQAAQRMNCSDALDSALLLLPEGVQVHGGGMLIMPGGPEAMLVQQWVTMP